MYGNPFLFLIEGAHKCNTIHMSCIHICLFSKHSQKHGTLRAFCKGNTKYIETKEI